MLEREMGIWDAPSDAWIGIPTNGTVKASGALVMGAGVAAQALERFLDLDKVLGRSIGARGNLPFYYRDMYSRRIFSFPVKRHWRRSADLELIRKSARDLAQVAGHPVHASETFYLPRPGCGNGRLLWSDVKPVIEFLPDNVIVVHKNLPTLVEVPVAHAKG